jgi:FtsH-binding integral membrane protein
MVEMKRLMMSAFIITASIFVSASIFAFLTVRRVLIYLGCLIASLVLSLIGIFVFRGPSSAILGLIIGILYVVVDTQLMIKKFENGLTEPYEDARQLFYDLVRIFIEILKILGSSEKKEKK